LGCIHHLSHRTAGGDRHLQPDLLTAGRPRRAALPLRGRVRATQGHRGVRSEAAVEAQLSEDPLGKRSAPSRLAPWLQPGPARGYGRSRPWPLSLRSPASARVPVGRAARCGGANLSPTTKSGTAGATIGSGSDSGTYRGAGPSFSVVSPSTSWAGRWPLTNIAKRTAPAATAGTWRYVKNWLLPKTRTGALSLLI
jgi:hypothetical protein